MLVLGPKSTEVKQKDPLIPKGGVLTVGFTSMSPDSGKGVFWSLPLAHLRFYGDPVRISSSISVDASRIQFDELLQVVLGSASASWERGDIATLQAAKLVQTMYNYLRHVDNKDEPVEIPVWLEPLASAAEKLQASTGLTRKSYLRLISLGKRRGGSFLTPLPCHPAPIFKLMRYHAVFGVFRGEEERIAALRAVADNMNLKDDECIIRYLVPVEARKRGF